jgi:membrane protease YdiL (CAAX protease family)
MPLSRAIDQETAILLALFPLITLGLVNGLYFPQLAISNHGLYWALDVLQFVVVPALAYRLLLKYGVQPKDYGLRGLAVVGSRNFAIGSSWPDRIGLIVFVSFIYWLTFEVAKALLYPFFWEGISPVTFSEALPEGEFWHWLLIVYAALTAGLIEEPVFRSLPWLYCSRRFRSPQRPYVLISSLLFGLVHWEQGTLVIIAAGFLGYVAALLYISIRNVWPFVIAHFLTDMWCFRELL